MPRQELHSDNIAIEQRPPVDDLADREGDVIMVDPSVASKDYAAELAFMDEPVTIRLEPSSDRNAIAVFPVWVNGRQAEIFQNGRWIEVGWLPVGREITVKRKVLEVIVRAKIDTVNTPSSDELAMHANPDNKVRRFTSAVHSFSVIEDKSPRGAAWLSEMRRRNF
jgi:hypothetical protein